VRAGCGTSRRWRASRSSRRPSTGPTSASSSASSARARSVSRWIAGGDWIERGALLRLFAEAEAVDAGTPTERPSAPIHDEPNDTGVGEAPPETIIGVVEHYDRVLTLRLSADQKRDLMAYLTRLQGSHQLVRQSVLHGDAHRLTARR